MARKVAIYARVSTEHEAQISALENQVQYYDDILSRHADWTLVDRYIDEGITGTSIHKRESFMRMLKDAKEKKFNCYQRGIQVCKKHSGYTAADQNPQNIWCGGVVHRR